METLIEKLRDTQAIAKLVGESSAFRDSIRSLPSVAKNDKTVLITGETGTGKELVARATHYLSPRAAFPFVPVNCGRLQDTLLEDDLFGHERGAFTNAHAQREGLIAQADRGTLFLDEVEALSPKAQVVLLRVLEHRCYLPVGSSTEKKADIRIVAATNAPLDRMVQEQRFRADLYYRLYVFSINLPPLRERKEDVVHLALHFLHKHTPPENTPLVLSQDAIDALCRYDWPGNIRELENAIIRSVHLCETNTVTLRDLGIPYSEMHSINPEHACDEESFKNLKRKTIEDFERDYLSRLMHQHRGNVSRAALAAGKERRELGRLLKKYHIDPNMFRPSSLTTAEDIPLVG